MSCNVKRLSRWAFNFAAAVSAVLLVGVCVLWVRSYHRQDYFYGEHLRGLKGREDQFSLVSRRGRIGYFRTRNVLAHGQAPVKDWGSSRINPRSRYDPITAHETVYEQAKQSQPWHFCGFSFWTCETGWPIWPNVLPRKRLGATVPYWSLALLGALLPAGWLARL